MESRSRYTTLVSFLYILLLSPFAYATTTADSEEALGPLTLGCPDACSDVNSDPAKWTEIHSWGELSSCAIPVLFALNVQNTASEYATMQTCAKYPVSVSRRDVSPELLERATGDAITIDNNCAAEKSSLQIKATYGPAALANGNDAAAASGLLVAYLNNRASCGSTILFAKSGTAVVGIYVGADVVKSSAASLISQAAEKFSSGTQVMQICDSNDRQAETVGVFAVGKVNDIPVAQAAVRDWANGKCIAISGQKSTQDVKLGVLTAPKVQKRDIELRSRITGSANIFAARATCKAIQVKSGDSCASLAKRCGISSANFNKYNTKSKLCSTLTPSQYVCCSSGTLPDKRPKPYSDGRCFTYNIKSGDGCTTLASNYGLTVSNIQSFNKHVWGWAGCTRLQIGQRICLSKGTAPIPKVVKGTTCGPQVPGTVRPSKTKTGWDLAGLNPCPLKACCSGHGFCGITGDFCTNTTQSGYGPGTSKPGTAGCVSNCKNTIRGNSVKPAKFINVGYFQGYNLGRPCLNMNVTDLTKVKTAYTHMHFAFAGITTSYVIELSPDVMEQFTLFVGMKASWKKVISFGGWAGSNDAATFQRYRNAIKSANREKFATNVMAFLNKYKLDGVDFDWEYPGAASGSTADATNYLEFLKVMRKKIGTSGKTMSVALPASYWGLSPFAVDKMAAAVDYIIYMTYDLHGQWDYGSQYASSGCPTGNCLRSHVNRTETHDAMSMITKAGVAPSKVIIGLSSYGRSFRMASSSCKGPMCKFTGSASSTTVELGACTQEQGILANAEITKIIADAKAGKKGVTAVTWYDASSDSDMMQWSTRGTNNYNWVAYMSESTKTKRTAYVKGLNFGGVIDWAVDLQAWYSPQPE